jgi:hypothetical protein
MDPFISPESVDTTAAIQMQIIETATDIGGQICEDIQLQENQESGSEISFQVGNFTMGTGGGGDDDNNADGDK